MFVQYQSHPTWVRGLKLSAFVKAMQGKRVAPYVGAWIETRLAVSYTASDTSHPTWVRGLKQKETNTNKNIIGRTLRGCVD